MTNTEKLKFIKLDSRSDVGLFLNKDEQKVNVSQADVYNDLRALRKGDVLHIFVKNIRRVKTKRMVVQNAPEVKKQEPIVHKYSNSICMIKDKQDFSFFSLPIGTRYYWLAFTDVPRIGQYVMSAVNSKYDISGVVTANDTKKRECTIDGFTYSVDKLSYVIMNPEIITKTKANA